MPRRIVPFLLLLSLAGCVTKTPLRTEFWEKQGLRISIAVAPYGEPFYDAAVDARPDTNPEMTEEQKNEAWLSAQLAGQRLEQDIRAFLSKFTPRWKAELKNFEHVKAGFRGRLENRGYLVEVIDYPAEERQIGQVRKETKADMLLLFSIQEYGMLCYTGLSDPVNEVELFISGHGKLIDIESGGVWWNSGTKSRRSSTGELGPFRIAGRTIAISERSIEGTPEPQPIAFDSRKEAEAGRIMHTLVSDLVSRFIHSFGFDNESGKPAPETTPLLEALRENDLDEAMALIGGREYIVQADVSGTTPLHLAAEKGYVDVARELIGIEQVNPGVLNGELSAPLHLAADKGHLAIIRSLCEAGADANPVDRSGRTPLHYAVFEGHFDVVRYLIGRQADPLAKDVWGYTALDYAIKSKKQDMVDFLRARIQATE